jgi:hypothetical protein
MPSRGSLSLIGSFTAVMNDDKIVEVGVVIE